MAAPLNIDENRPQLAGFNAFYEKEISGYMESHVDRHKQAKTFAFVFGGLGALLLPLLIWLYILLDIRLHEFSGELAIALPLLYAVGVGFVAVWPLRKLHGEVKGHLLTKVCGFMGLEYSLKPVGFPFDTFNGAGLLPHHHQRKIEDNIKGAHEGVDFNFAECVLKRRQQSGRTTTYVEVYHGLLFQFTFAKRFNGKTLVSRDSGTVGNFFKGIGKKERIKLEDPRFEKVFEVYGTDQVEARYLLTPAFMERIMALAEHVGQKQVELAFLDDHLLLSIRVSEDQFEAGGLFADMTDTKRIESLIKELCLVYDVVDTLKLNIQTKV